MSSLLKKRIMGFTLLEIMVSVAIIAILATISIIATTRVRLKSRDIKRISNATEIVSALEAYYAANQSYPTMIFPGQPIASNGREYLRAVPSNPSPRTDGGCADTDYTYITTTTGYKLTFCIGSDNSRFAQGIVICKNGNCGIKEDCSGEITDIDGTRYPIVRIGDQCWMATHLRTKRRPDASCIILDTGSEYDTDMNTCTVTYLYPLFASYKFGGYGCFPVGCIPDSRRDCIKSVGPIIPLGTPDPQGDTGWLNRGHDIAGPYDYPPSNSSDCNYRGALYTWAAAMNFDDNCLGSSCSSLISSPHRGICPAGWHIPTDQEFHTLESTLTNSGNQCDPNRNSHAIGFDSCRNAGSELVIGGFDADLLGVRLHSPLVAGSDFQGIDQSAYFWTTKEGSPNAYGQYLTAFARIIDSGISGTYRFEEYKETAATVRCIRDY